MKKSKEQASTKEKETTKAKPIKSKEVEKTATKAKEPQATKGKDVPKEQKDGGKKTQSKQPQSAEPVGGKKAQKESKASQKAAELVEKEKWRKTMMLENEEDNEEEENLSEVDEEAFRDGLRLAMERTMPGNSRSATTTTTSTTSTNTTHAQEKDEENTVTIHKAVVANFDSPIEPITPMLFSALEQQPKQNKPVKESSKKIALARALAKAENGEALSNKERRALARQIDEPEVIECDAVTQKDDNLLYSLRNFSVGDVSAEKKIEESSTKDIIIERFSISAPQKPLFVHAELRLNHGSRYGLMGPNGQGKTTLLKHIAARVLPIPSHIRVMYVEQEVQASEHSAVQTVLQVPPVFWCY